ncbi:anthranilate synthase [Synchytrium endobioticum]|nr:anthranilate synthase [Synchytrium endobioticum]
MIRSEDALALRTLLIDNFDSYTFNIFQQLVLSRSQVIVIRNNLPWDRIRDEILPHFDNIVISPGPGDPTHDGDFGSCHEIIKYSTIPILGVCLGHQGLATAFGGRVMHADEPMHGRTSPVYHDADGMFDGLTQPFKVVRYHSLIADERALPDCLRVSAWTPSTINPQRKIIMGLQHKSKPIYGVQFHPESICTEQGMNLISNFMKITTSYLSKFSGSKRVSCSRSIPDQIRALTIIPAPIYSPVGDAATSQRHLVVEKIQNVMIDSESVFRALFAHKPVSFWLDSARIEPGLSRFSFMGDCEGEDSFVVKYRTSSRKVTTIKPHRQHTYETQLDPNETFFTYIARLVYEYSLSRSTSTDTPRITTRPTSFDIPFDLMCGFVGHVGYEMKCESLSAAQRKPFKMASATPIPDAAFIFAKRVVVFDHLKKDAYIVMLSVDDTPVAPSADQNLDLVWLKDVKRILQSTAHCTNGHCQPRWIRSRTEKAMRAKTQTVPDTIPVKSDNSNIHNAVHHDSSSRESKTPKQVLSTALDMYHHLRTTNPTPHASFINFGDGFIILSASPEEFMTVDRDGVVQARPIKGTVRRDLNDVERDGRLKKELERSEKNIAENLMIVDLLRNDLNLICDSSSVCVPSLFKVETYASIHTMVSTIKGNLRPGLTAVDAVMKCFPPGSMTGAPKLRTVEILEDLEKSPRGVYSGCLGYFSLTGEADFAVVIRTAVIHDREISVGAGGAIVSLSSPLEEYDEMILKLSSVLPSVTHAFGIEGIVPHQQEEIDHHGQQRIPVTMRSTVYEEEIHLRQECMIPIEEHHPNVL